MLFALAGLVLPLNVRANMNGANFDGLIYALLALLVIYILNWVLTIVNVFSKKKWLSVINILVAVPYLLLGFYAMMAGIFGFLLVVLFLVQCLLIYRSFNTKPVQTGQMEQQL